MKTQTSVAILLALAASLFSIAILNGCKSTTIVDNLGSLRGNVALVNPNADTLSNYSGAIASIQGTSFQATSNAAGDWQIDNVPAGIYNIVMTKPGFDTLVLPQVQFSGAGTSFLLSNAIQAVPQDSLDVTFNNTTIQSSGGVYEGELQIFGKLLGKDSLEQASYDITFGAGTDSATTTTQSFYVINGIPTGVTETYFEPKVASGSVVMVRSHLWARVSTTTMAFAHFQQAECASSLVRTYQLP